jgi:microcystin-dependent protein
MGEKFGSESTTITTNQMPSHTHVGSVKALPTAGNSTSPVGNNFALAPANDYSNGTAPANNLKADSLVVGNTGGSQPADIKQPYLAMKWCISLFGIFPSP